LVKKLPQRKKPEEARLTSSMLRRLLNVDTSVKGSASKFEKRN
jgi:hypothetical protein